MGDADYNDGSYDCGGYDYDDDDYEFEETCDDYDEVETTEVNAAAADNNDAKEQRYVVLTEDAVRARQAAETLTGCGGGRLAHAYGYFLDPKRDVVKRNLFDQLQKDANMLLERLHDCVEVERKKLLSAAGGDDVAGVTERFKSYKKKLENLTTVTRRYFENLVKAFETDLAEVETAK